MTLKDTWRHAQNEIVIHLKIQPKSPLIIQEAKERADNLSECLMYKSNGIKNYYIPGSSIKGILRSHSEKIFYHLLGVDLISDETKKLNLSKTTAEQFYSELNPINKMFGHHSFKGRLTIEDAIFDKDSVQLDKRMNVAIDRFRGGSKNGALFEMELLTKGEANTKIHLKNAAEWQIVWLCYLIKDLQEGYISVGAKSGIGYGTLNVDLLSLDVIVMNKEIEQKWNNWLILGEQLSHYYKKVYRFKQLDTIATNLQSQWENFLDSTKAKEGVNA